jgi:hypothetical protein
LGLSPVVTGIGFASDTVKNSSFVAVAEALSVTCTVKEAVVAAVGVPDSTPFPDNERPCGSVPAVTAHE